MDELLRICGGIIGASESTPARSAENDGISKFLCRNSKTAAWALFLGGFGRMQSKWAQKLYDFAFVASFLMCWASCLANLFVQAPPFFELTIDIATVYFHLCGLHLWVFWRSFLLDGHLNDVVRCCEVYAPAEGKARQELAFISRVAARGMLVVQVAMIVLGFIVFPQPAIEHYLMEKSSATSVFSAVHAILMWIAIPQHVATVVSSLTLYFIVGRLHMLDILTLSDIVWDQDLPLFEHRADETSECYDAKVQSILLTTCEAVEGVQRRLGHTCRRMCLAWYHQVFYGVVVLAVVHEQMIVSVSSRGDTGQDEVDDWTVRQQLFRYLYAVWHGAMGSLIFFTALIMPAQITGRILDMPHKVFSGLRGHGISIQRMDSLLIYLQTNCVGYRVGYTQVSETTIGTVISVMTILSSIYSLQMRDAHQADST
eukprot:gnl/TRDRNA2_/TRDRNA2_150900_c1_seq2.p1 gnl/TRDRNA2_/TRDRNA2_150900_c1~~gnl/TRDRNA2_/TRDRNA2_150900_c1_seq2.p1  ORF type:complete len:428 (+),score=33.29 gnl/TRDRNA2_/TRDRNA2_150900_c1_seq2:3-1286(+)